MPSGKPAGVACKHLADDMLCALYGAAERPKVCLRFPPQPDTCGSSFSEALALMAEMEKKTAPGSGAS